MSLLQTSNVEAFNGTKDNKVLVRNVISVDGFVGIINYWQSTLLDILQQNSNPMETMGLNAKMV
jgi:hypothetical protein